MPVSNFDIVLAVIDTVEESKRSQVECEFRKDFRAVAATISADYAEALARSETLFLLHRLDLDFEGAAYLRSHLR